MERVEGLTLKRNVCYNPRMSMAVKSRNIVLIGFMGAGKSLVAKKLAIVLKREIVETDKSIEERERRTISEIFRDTGEPYFRKVEKEVISEVSRKKNLIIDCGGGAVLDKDNRENLRKRGFLIYLAATPEVIYGRIKHQTHRPLLSGDMSVEKISALLQIRKPLYEQSDLTVDTSYKTPEKVAEEILKVIAHG